MRHSVMRHAALLLRMENLISSLLETEWIFILVVGIVLLGASELGLRIGYQTSP